MVKELRKHYGFSITDGTFNVKQTQNTGLTGMAGALNTLGTSRMTS
jgi:hypothetical protein